MYKNLTENRSPMQVKYKYINTVLRSDEVYNNIPYLIRNKKPKNFKTSYKNYIFELPYKPRVIKHFILNKYILVRPGE